MSLPTTKKGNRTRMALSDKHIAEISTIVANGGYWGDGEAIFRKLGLDKKLFACQVACGAELWLSSFTSTLMGLPFKQSSMSALL